MIHITIPYSKEQDFFQAICNEFEKVSNQDDWVVIMDGDTMFLQPDFGAQLQEYIDLYPSTGMFTCYASRCSYSYQVPGGVDQENPNILYHKMISDQMRQLYQGDVRSINTRIAGHLMMIKKSTWVKILPGLSARIQAKEKKVLGVDTQITWSILKSGLLVHLMCGVYILHYFRLLDGRKSNSHVV